MAAKDPSELLPVSEANNHLAVCLYKLMAKEQANVFFSPFSISTALAMLFCGSRGETANEMKQVLGYDAAKITDEEVKSGFQYLLMTLKSTASDYILSCANMVVIHKEFIIKDEFKSVLEQSFDAKLQKVDFMNDLHQAIYTVNNWVRAKTNNMIPKLVDTLDGSNAMVLLNAIYFKGLWLNQFNKSKTFEEKFYNNGMEYNAKRIQMMHLTEKFLYIEKESFKTLSLPYKGEHISMVILLPNLKNGLKNMESSLIPTSFSCLLRDMRKRNVKVSLPKFRLEYFTNLKEQFKSIGMNKLFNIGADFGGISDSKELLISEIVHKAVVEVNEEGSEAAAVTGAMMAFGCAPQIVPEFTVDHPFLFVIYDTKNNLILFMGRVNELGSFQGLPVTKNNPFFKLGL